MEAKEQTEIRQLGEKLQLSQDKYDIDTGILNDKIEDLKNQLIIVESLSKTTPIQAESQSEKETAIFAILEDHGINPMVAPICYDDIIKHFESLSLQAESVSDEEIERSFKMIKNPDNRPYITDLNRRNELRVQGIKWMRDRLSQLKPTGKEIGDVNTISDGCGSEWTLECAECGEDTMQVVRPGKAQCSNCG